jgi:hypothetical protein
MAAVLGRALLAITVFVASAPAVQTADGFLGRPLAEVARGDFFTTFKLAEVRRRMSGEFAQIVFQPPAPSSDHVRVVIRTNGEGEIRIIDAALDRAFVDGASRPLARDFVRVLLHDAIPPGDEASIGAFVKELSGAAPKQPSAAYEVFSGTRTQITAVGKRTRVTLTNVGTGPASVFRVSIQRAAAGQH